MLAIRRKIKIRVAYPAYFIDEFRFAIMHRSLWFYFNHIFNPEMVRHNIGNTLYENLLQIIRKLCCTLTKYLNRINLNQQKFIFFLEKVNNFFSIHPSIDRSSRLCADSFLGGLSGLLFAPPFQTFVRTDSAQVAVDARLFQLVSDGDRLDALRNLQLSGKNLSAQLARHLQLLGLKLSFYLSTI